MIHGLVLIRGGFIALVSEFAVVDERIYLRLGMSLYVMVPETTAGSVPPSAFLTGVPVLWTVYFLVPLQLSCKGVVISNGGSFLKLLKPLSSLNCLIKFKTV